jgi:glycosyltransferase involved in cell wall biosynthesis
MVARFGPMPCIAKSDNSIPLLIAADINTLWRRRPFEALAQATSVLGLAPMDPLVAWRKHRWPLRQISGACDAHFSLLPVLMLPGWASGRATKVLPRLWMKALAWCQARGEKPQGLFVTSPHYLPLVAAACNEVPCYYYCSDDYRSYSGWSGDEMKEKEGALMSQVDHAFFVSQPLAERAVADYGMPNAKVSVSMNATEELFMQPVEAAEIRAIFDTNPRLRRPVAGVIGGVNDRLDFDLLLACAELPELGTLLFVGAVEDSRSQALRRIRQHPKCLFVGKQPHAELPSWLQLLDVALMPYRHTEFNRLCSPMRLFDHLASGRSIVATDGCPQVLAMQRWVQVTKEQRTFLEMLANLLKRGSAPRLTEMVNHAEKHTWASRSRLISMQINTPK